MQISRDEMEFKAVFTMQMLEDSALFFLVIRNIRAC